ncbi:protein involved in gliding motility GldD [Flavobacteriaceae bacterium MAR_2010_188]|nr:protein involved in gliding motility GldD [Flavobacteriaceae bacterium MAR_2010_188]
MKQVIIPVMAFLLLGCGDEPLPKPKAALRLEYPTPEYSLVNLDIPFSFEKNNLAAPITKIKIDKANNDIGIDINYPALKGTIYLTYRNVDGNLNRLLKDAQNITQKHASKADEISEQVFDNASANTHGMFYEVGGNAASQSQFYLTDSTHHFLNGSLYFYAKPNFDSIYPAAVYLKNDIKHLMESVKWK